MVHRYRPRRDNRRHRARVRHCRVRTNPTEPVGVTLLRGGLCGFIGVDADGGRNGAGYSGLPMADRFGVPAAMISVFTCDMCDGGWRGCSSPTARSTMPPIWPPLERC